MCFYKALIISCVIYQALAGSSSYFSPDTLVPPSTTTTALPTTTVMKCVTCREVMKDGIYPTDSGCDAGDKEKVYILIDYLPEAQKDKERIFGACSDANLGITEDQRYQYFAEYAATHLVFD